MIEDDADMKKQESKMVGSIKVYEGAEDFNKEIMWTKRCPVCNEHHSETKKRYSTNDMIGNAVQVSVVRPDHGIMFQLCEECIILYTPWKSL